MSWRWRNDPPPSDADGLGFSEPFDSQADAEAWLGAHFLDLADAGVAEVSLYEEDRLVYGPMSLEAE